MKKFYLATIGTLLYIPIITIAGELYEPLKNFLKNTFWHHWLGKSVVLVALYVLLLLIFSNIKENGEEREGRYVSFVIGLAFIGAITIFGFFVVEYMQII